MGKECYPFNITTTATIVKGCTNPPVKFHHPMHITYKHQRNVKYAINPRENDGNQEKIIGIISIPKKAGVTFQARELREATVFFPTKEAPLK